MAQRSRAGVVLTFVNTSTIRYLKQLEAVFGPSVKPFFEWPDKSNPDKMMHAASELLNRPIYFGDYGCDFHPEVPKDGKDKAEIVLALNVKDAKAIETQALANGATTVNEVKQQFWGSIWGSFRDPAGITWSVSSDPPKENDKDESKATTNGNGTNEGTTTTDTTTTTTTTTTPQEEDHVLPEHQRNVTPELSVADADAEIAWIQKVFNAKLEGEIYRSKDGQVLHSVLSLNNGGLVYVCSQFEPSPTARVTATLTVPPGTAQKYADAFVKVGGAITMPIAKQFWGQVYGRVVDAFGLDWAFAEPHPEEGGEGEEASKKRKREEQNGNGHENGHGQNGVENGEGAAKRAKE